MVGLLKWYTGSYDMITPQPVFGQWIFLKAFYPWKGYEAVTLYLEPLARIRPNEYIRGKYININKGQSIN